MNAMDQHSIGKQLTFRFFFMEFFLVKRQMTEVKVHTQQHVPTVRSQMSYSYAWIQSPLSSLSSWDARMVGNLPTCTPMKY